MDIFSHRIDKLSSKLELKMSEKIFFLCLKIKAKHFHNELFSLFQLFFCKPFSIQEIACRADRESDNKPAGKAVQCSLGLLLIKYRNNILYRGCRLKNKKRNYHRARNHSRICSWLGGATSLSKSPLYYVLCTTTRRPRERATSYRGSIFYRKQGSASRRCSPQHTNIHTHVRNALHKQKLPTEVLLCPQNKCSRVFYEKSSKM